MNKSFQIGAIAGYLLTDLIKPNRNVKSGSIQVSYDIKPSSKDCYARMKELLESRDIPMKIKEVSKSEGNLSTGRRLYLKVKKGRFTYWLCAAPYGNTFFFSYWLKQSHSFLAGLLRWIPFFGPMMFSFLTKMSFYKADSYAVFQYVVTDALNQTANEMTESHGLRAMAPENQATLKTNAPQVPAE